MLFLKYQYIFLVFTSLAMTFFKLGSVYYSRAFDDSSESVSYKNLGEPSPLLFPAVSEVVKSCSGEEPQ